MLSLWLPVYNVLLRGPEGKAFSIFFLFVLVHTQRGKPKLTLGSEIIPGKLGDPYGVPGD